LLILSLQRQQQQHSSKQNTDDTNGLMLSTAGRGARGDVMRIIIDIFMAEIRFVLKIN
jgi:hypothetical protein